METNSDYIFESFQVLFSYFVSEASVSLRRTGVRSLDRELDAASPSSSSARSLILWPGARSNTKKLRAINFPREVKQTQFRLSWTTSDVTSQSVGLDSPAALLILTFFAVGRSLSFPPILPHLLRPFPWNHKGTRQTGCSPSQCTPESAIDSFPLKSSGIIYLSSPVRLIWFHVSPWWFALNKE